MSATEYYVYIVQCADDTLYTGYTTDLAERIQTHNGHTNKLGAKYTRGRRPVQLVYSEQCATKSAAMQREAAIKKLSRTEKQQLISS